MHILSVDFGTSSLKLVVMDENLNRLKSAKVLYELKIRNGNWIELDPDELWEALRLGIEKLSEYKDSIELLCFDTFSPSMTFMDREGEALIRTVTHLDRRSKKQSERILAEMGKNRFQQITGMFPFTGGSPVTTVLWVRENLPEVFEKTYRLGHFNTYVYKRLTGLWATEHTNASMSGMYETAKAAGWSKEICETFGIPMEKLPAIKAAGTIEAGLCKREADFLGLREGIPVALGTNDVAAALIGAGNTTAGSVLDISGSSEIISVLTDIPRVDSRYYLRASATPGLWQAFAIASSGFSIDWFRREFYRDMDERTFFDVEMAEAIHRNLGSCPVRFLPYMTGDRQSLLPKKGGFLGLTLDTTRQDMLAAILIGIHNHVVDLIHICEGFLPEMKREITLTGGMMDDNVIELKKALLPGYSFNRKDDCPHFGNATLALQNLQG